MGKAMTYISLFSGIEAASLAWMPLGWEPVAFCEVDDFASEVLARRFPDVPNLHDVTKVDWSKYHGAARVVCGGFPCQSYSLAGLRKGLADPRGELMLEFLRACKEIDPEWIVGENVPGLLSSHGGRDFQTFLEAVAILWPGGGVSWRILDAQFARVPIRDDRGGIAGWFGPVAQRRRRVFLVINTRDWRRAAAVCAESEGLPWDTQSSKQKRQELAGAAGRGAAAGGGAGFCGYASRTAKSIGYESELSPTLKGNDWQASVPDVLHSAGFKFHQGSDAGGIGFEDEQSPTLTADWHNPAVLSLQGDGTRSCGSQNGLGASDDGASYTLNTIDRHSVAYAVDYKQTPKVTEDMSHTLTHEGQGGIHSAVMTQYGEELAGTLTARNDSSPCADRGQNVLAVNCNQDPTTDMEHTGAIDHNGTAVSYALKVRCGSDTYLKRDGTVGTAGKGALVGEECAFTVASSQDQTLVCMEPGPNSLTPWDTQGRRAYSEHGPYPTLDARAVLCMASGAANAETCENVSPTLLARMHKQPPMVCASNGQDVVGTICARDGKGVGSEYVAEGKVVSHESLEDMAVTIHDGTRWIVRRITPTEAERLQWMPDGWTDIPWNGKPHAPDSRRYKAIGNSFAVPVVRMLGERIQMVEEMIEEIGGREDAATVI